MTRGNLNWRDNLAIGDVVDSPDDKACVVTDIDGDTITLRLKDDQDADTFMANRGDLK